MVKIDFNFSIHENFSKIDLVNIDDTENLKEVLKFFIKNLNIKQCRQADIFLYRLFNKHKDLQKNNPDLYKDLQVMQIECKWISLMSLNDQAIFNLFEKYINLAWEIPKKYNVVKIDSDYYWQKVFLVENLEDFIDSIILFRDQDKFKNELMDVMRQNQEVITKARIIIENKILKPTLAHWFEVYFSEVGTGEADNLKMASFFSKDKNFQKLTEEEKTKLRLLFGIYEKLKLSSLTPKGNPSRMYIVDEQGREGYYKYGKFNVILNNRQNENILHNEQIEEKELKEEPKGVIHDIFSEIDEKEINQHKNQSASLNKNSEDDSNKTLQELKESFKLEFANIIFEKRFDNLTISFLKGIRGSMEYQDMLTRAEKVGGLGYDANLSSRIIDYLKEKNPHLKKQVKLPQTATAAPKDKEEKPVFDYKKALKVINQAKASGKIGGNTSSPAPQKIEEKKPKIKEGVKPDINLPQTVIIPQMKRLKSDKPMMQDIKPKKQNVVLTGPLEEIKSLNLAKFRRLADNPIEASERIEEKIELLSEKSLEEKAKGIRAFKASDLNKLYLTIGNTSINKGKSVLEVITELEEKSEPFLTKEEFDAVSDLNKKLRF